MNVREIKIGTNQPLLLSQHDKVWMILAGEVEIFYVNLNERGALSSSRSFLYTAKKGDLLFSLKTKKTLNGICLMAVSSKARLIEYRKEEIAEVNPYQLQNQLNEWILNLSESLQSNPPPRVYEALENGQKTTLLQSQIAFPPKGILWVEQLSGTLNIYGAVQPREQEKICKFPIPVSSQLWIQASSEECKIKTLETFDVVKDELTTLQVIHFLQQHFYQQIQDRYTEEIKSASQKIDDKVQSDARTIASSLTKLGSIIYSKSKIAAFSKINTDNSLLATCQLIGQQVGFKFAAPKFMDENTRKTTNQLYAIAQISNARVRKVILRGEWWKEENGHLLAFTKEDHKPVALIQQTSDTYMLKDVETKTNQKVNRKVAESLDPIAYMFFYAFDEPMTSISKIWSFAIKGLKKDAWYIVLAALSGSLIGLLVPILSGILFDDVIPQADRGFLIEVFGIMLIIGLVTALLRLIQGVLQLRLETKSNINVQAGLMDHLLRLPITFYRKYSAGDLTLRALSINSIRQILSSTVLTAVLSGAFSFVNLFLLFYYDSSLAWVGIGLALFAVTVVIGIGFLKLKYDREIAQTNGDIQGFLFEFLSGITKIRVTGAEQRIFSIWADRFSDLKLLGFRSGSHQNYVEVFNGSYPLVTNIFFFGFIYYTIQTAGIGGKELISVGAFMAFVTAFNQFLNDCLNISMALITSLNMIPLYERVKPILEEVPESTDESGDPGELKGEIELNSVNFRYAPDQPLVLKDVSFRIKQGEMVAFVGPSGSGKSTVLRILLGFEEPESGSVYYDGQAYDSLNKDLVRRQLGVVLQNGALMAGSIYKNIVGNSELNLEDAWQAAKMAGMEEDIKQMPMEMHTVISEGAGTFSGGQRQRLMIARAIVHKPRILYMDEATSALDNRTQNIVSESLDRLQATRIVIAHRLSTVINADRIYVMEDGVIVESGTYQELIEQDGLFSKLAKRQIA